MTSQVQGKGSAVTILLALVLITGPSVCFSADDMWTSVFEYQQKMADYGNPEAQVKLGQMYEEGHGTEQDFGKAREWYQKAANQGYAPAKKKLGKLEARRRKERERLAREELERVRAERKKADDAERAKHNQSQPRRQSMSESSAKKHPSEQAKQEAEARNRAAEAIKKMMAVPSAYSED